MRVKTKDESKKETKTNITNSDESLICTICDKKFKPNDDTKYIARGGYTCSWKCFLDYVKRREKEKKEENKYKENKKCKK